MLIGLGLIVLSILFGGPQNDLLLSQIGKYAKKEVVDNDRKTLVLTEIKAVKSIQKGYDKTTKGNKKNLKKLVSNQSTTQVEFTELFHILVEYEQKVNNVFVPHRLLVQQTLTQEEWDNILESASRDIEKSKKTTDKRLKSLKKALDKTQKTILKHLADKDKDNASKCLQDFNSYLYDVGEDMLNYNPLEENLLLNKDASAEDLLFVIDNDIKEWEKILGKLADLHVTLAKIVPENEWSAVAKQINKIY